MKWYDIDCCENKYWDEDHWENTTIYYVDDLKQYYLIISMFIFYLLTYLSCGIAFLFFSIKEMGDIFLGLFFVLPLVIICITIFMASKVFRKNFESVELVDIYIKGLVDEKDYKKYYESLINKIKKQEELT